MTKTGNYDRRTACVCHEVRKCDECVETRWVCQNGKERKAIEENWRQKEIGGCKWRKGRQDEYWRIRIG